MLHNWVTYSLNVLYYMRLLLYLYPWYYRKTILSFVCITRPKSFPSWEDWDEKSDLNNGKWINKNLNWISWKDINLWEAGRDCGYSALTSSMTCLRSSNYFWWSTDRIALPKAARHTGPQQRRPAPRLFIGTREGDSSYSGNVWCQLNVDDVTAARLWECLFTSLNVKCLCTTLWDWTNSKYL